MNTIETGRKGEEVASKYLLDNGFEIIERNFNAEFGEIDIVAVKNKRTYFIEVKTQSTNQRTEPEDELTRDKIAGLKRLSEFYAMTHPQVPQNLTISAVCVRLRENGDSEVKFYEDVME